MELGANLGDLDGINAPNFFLKMGLGFMQIAQNEYFGGGGDDALVGIGT
jgi:hypothetical protein